MSRKFFFTADQHFGHANIIKYCKRPFSDSIEMDGVLIGEWNAVIGKDDLVYHLGDFTLGDKVIAEHYFNALNGRILVLGNWWHHDRRWLPNSTGQTNYESRDALLVRVVDPLYVFDKWWLEECSMKIPPVLCHYPFAVWDRKHYGAIHFHAHSHGYHRSEGKILDVGVDSAYNLMGRYAPFSLDEAIAFATKEL